MSADLRSAVRTHLLANTNISNEVGTRVYPVHLPQNVTYPAISFQKISDLTEGNVGEMSRIRQARIQFDTWADTALKASELAEYVRDQFDGFKGTVDGVEIAVGIIGSETDLYEESIERYRVTCDYEVTYYS